MAPRDLSATAVSEDETHRRLTSPLRQHHAPLVESSSSTTMTTGDSMIYKGTGPVTISDWGYPGHLTDAEYAVFEKFRTEVKKGNEKFRSTVFCFEDANEDETYALCRWLRARKFDLSETILMVKEATECRSEAAQKNFYPDPADALGIDPSIYLSQFPQLHYGFAKNGYPLFLSKPGRLNIPGIECITSIEGVLKYHWFVQMWDMANQFKYSSSRNPNYKRYECVCVLDLEHLTSAQVSKRSMHIIKTQTFVDSLCFPETLYKMIIINAPSFFTITWKIIKGWVDVRTSNKVEIYGTKRTKWERRLRELVDSEELPSDYGGAGESTAEVLERRDTYTYSRRPRRNDLEHVKDGIHNKNHVCTGVTADGFIRQVCHAMSLRQSASKFLSLSSGHIMKIQVCTRSLVGGTVHITSPCGKMMSPKSGFLVRHRGNGGDEEEPTRIELNVVLKQAGNYKVKIVSNGGRFGTENFMIVGQIYRNVDDSVELTNVSMLEEEEDDCEVIDLQAEKPESNVGSAPNDAYVKIDGGDGEEDLEDIALTSHAEKSTPQGTNQAILPSFKKKITSDNSHHSKSATTVDSQKLLLQPTFELMADAKKEALQTASTVKYPRHGNTTREDKTAASASSAPQNQQYVTEDDSDLPSTGMFCSGGAMSFSFLSSFLCGCGSL